MTTRNRMMAATSTAALVAGGLFLTTAPAHAAPDSPACLSAQAQFEAVLADAGVNSALTVELSAALQDVLDAQASLEALEAAAVLDVAAVQPDLDLALQTQADAEADVRDAELALSAALSGLLGDANAALTAAVTAEGLAEADVVTAQADYDAAVASGVQADIDAALIILNAAVADEAAAEQARVDAEAAVALLAGGDLDAIVAAEALIDGVLGVDVTLIDDLQAALDAMAAANADVLDAQAAVEAAANLDAILAANATLDAAIDAVNGLQIDLDALAIDVDELEVLYAESIAACSGDVINIDIGIDGAGAADVEVDGTDAEVNVDVDDNWVGAAGGSNGDGTNQGMNVQTAVPAATSSSPMLGGAIVAGLGSLAAAGAWLRRKA